MPWTSVLPPGLHYTTVSGAPNPWPFHNANRLAEGRVRAAVDRTQRGLMVWLRQRDFVPLRYTVAWTNAKGQTYYINALYANCNSVVAIAPPDTSNRGVVQAGTPVALQSGSVTVRDLTFDCVGTALRHPASHDKFVLEVLLASSWHPGAPRLGNADWLYVSPPHESL